MSPPSPLSLSIGRHGRTGRVCKEGMKTFVSGQQWGLEDSALGFHAFIFFQQEPSSEVTQCDKATVPHTQQDSEGSLLPSHVPQGG